MSHFRHKCREETSALGCFATYLLPLHSSPYHNIHKTKTDRIFWHRLPPPCPPTLKGTTVAFDVENEIGLPKSLSIDAHASIFSAIRKATRGATPTLLWKEPITIATQLKLTLVDEQQMHNDPRRLVKVILRSRPKFQGRPAIDNVKLAVEVGVNRERMYFARCIAFFQDADDNVFVALRWYTEVPGNLIDPVVHLTPLTLAPENRPASFSIMPAHAISNGALIVARDNKFWAMQSPREAEEYKLKNSA